MTPEELQAIRERNEERRRDNEPYEHMHGEHPVADDIDALLAEIERLRALGAEIACMTGAENHDHELCHTIAAAITRNGAHDDE